MDGSIDQSALKAAQDWPRFASSLGMARMCQPRAALMGRRLSRIRAPIMIRLSFVDRVAPNLRADGFYVRQESIAREIQACH